MKLKLFLTVVLCSLSLVVQAQRGARIAYIDMDVILSKNKEFRTANQLLDEKIVQWKKEIELKKIQLKQIEDQFAVEKILLTPELIADREMEIKDFASEVVSLQEKRFGPNGDMMIQKNQLLKPVQDQVLSIVQDIAKERKYDFVFDRSSDIIMLYSAKNYDISDLVLRRIQAQERIKERKEKINSAKKGLNGVSN
ncbi:MAG: OmpH family outer membrane protein [Flavobacteriaceae bacterium]|jgi:Skp family chaperone for outer membrane proteins|nr:OmpH family outer membrane protein [Flavobacteriaceae bacterium]MBT6127440.1 OmpH family outer membrane protein [Flavobacteriaceae bacterium]MDG1028068.1 OmpH family outer membrane protein [Flavobacteriaceae bacterium]MDG1941482.1 OmpH family outer membrane protein [Flavobacteriaceae bacterium]